MTTTLVDYRAADGVAVLTLTNPPMNAYSYELFRQLDDAILRARFDDAVHVLVLTGAGDRAFCAGADIAMLQAATPAYKYQFCLHANETLLRLEHTSKLVIAAINGHCIGGGLEVAMAADLRFARAGKFQLGLPEVALGVLPGTGGTQRLTRLLGKARALELMVTGAKFSPERAVELGLATEVLPADGFLDAVLARARQFCPPHAASRAVGLIKRAVQTGGELPLEAGLALERELQQRLFTGDDAREGLDAFVGRRPPRFTGG
jgi:enoyl-CoA hydratase/carnithine racemase